MESERELKDIISDRIGLDYGMTPRTNCMDDIMDAITADRRRCIEAVVEPLKKYDAHAGHEQGPFKDCDCPSHHAHSEHGQDGCPVCMTKWVKEALAKCEEMKGDGK